MNPTMTSDVMDWLLESDRKNPSVRYFTMLDLLDADPAGAEMREARAAIMQSGPVPKILDAQSPEGYWDKPGGGYNKYRGTVWQIMRLGEFGADPADERVRLGCAYVLTHTVADNHGFAMGTVPHAHGVIHCLNGNLVEALIRLGYLHDQRVQAAIDWQARAITGRGPIAYFRSGTSAPGFACAMNDGLPCAWGAVKALKGLLAIPVNERTPLVVEAVEQSVELLLSGDLVRGEYPTKSKVSESWFRLGFPLSYWSDILEALQVLADAGYAADARLAPAYRWLLSRRDEGGRWTMEHSINGRMWGSIEQREKPSKWVTLRALRAVRLYERAGQQA